MKASILVLLIFAAAQCLSADSVSGRWAARWVDVPGSAPQAYGVYHFRHSFDLATAPEHFVVHVSGDNRYQFFVNGTRMSIGPARGDLSHWRYETVDIAAQLRAGRNVLAAVVWNDGEFRAVAQVSNQTGFLLQADRAEDAAVNTNKSWLCLRDQAYSPLPLPEDQRTGYYALAANEHFDSKAYPWGWEQPQYPDAKWLPAHEISQAAARDTRDGPNRWMLVSSFIPQEEQTREQNMVLRNAEGLLRAHFPQQALTIPAHTKAALLLDQRYLTTAYPELNLSGGQGAEVKLRYSETLFVNKESRGHPMVKGNRNLIDGKQFYGSSDTYISDGGADRTYRPLFWRTFRYLRIEIQTGESPLTLHRLTSTFTAYPFKRTATFAAGDTGLNQDFQRILNTGWRTARLCAHETYMDCPYYEQLQYGGDARIQMLISLYMTGDARLMKNGISLLNSSRTSEGATYSRAPSALQQYIPPFSLWWIGMVHDYWMYVDDPAFVKEMLPGVHAVLSFYAGHQKASGSLGKMPWWNFVDWVKQWPTGEPPGEPDGGSAAALDLQLLLAYGWAADLEAQVGSKALAEEYRLRAEQIKATVLATDWDSQRGLIADQPSHSSYSQQTNTLAILAHVVPPERTKEVMEQMIHDVSLAQSSIYFRAYTNAALREVGMGNQYVHMLAPWHEMLEQGLTTWAEWNGQDSRSDCHAWGASPNFELLRTVAGIESGAPGFRRVRIAPNPGDLEQVSAEMSHPKGAVRVKLTSRKGQWTAAIDLPPETEGEFVWGGKSRALQPGSNRFALDAALQ